MKIKSISNQTKKVGYWFFKNLEIKFRDFLLKRIPPWFETYHLTYMTLGWIILAIISGYLAQFNLNYLTIISVAIIGQYITDLLDGAVGRKRNTGLILWGFYMDHFLDFVFLCAILIGYWFAIPAQFHYIIMATLILSSAYFVHTILYFGATGKFEIATLGIGPTEMRIILVIINTMLAFLNQLIFVSFLYIYFIANAVMLVVSVHHTQKLLWELDMEKKKDVLKNSKL